MTLHRALSVQIFHLPYVLAMTMTHILLTLAYEETTLISAMLVWALLIMFLDVDVDKQHFLISCPKHHSLRTKL